MKMKRAWKSLLALVFGLALLVTAGCLGSNRNFSSSASSSQPSAPSTVPASSSQVGVRPGNKAPDFALKSLDGKTVRLSEFQGKPVLVNFWATWCPPCKEEMPAMQKVYEKYQGQVAFLGLDMKEDASTVEKFVKDNGYSWTFLLDQDGKAGRDYQVTGVPETFFIDRNGVLQDRVIGAMSASLLESKLAKIK